MAKKKKTIEQPKPQLIKDEEEVGYIEPGLAMYDPSDRYIKTYGSIMEAAEELRVSPNGIILCLEGMRDIAYGYKWKIVR